MLRLLLILLLLSRWSFCDDEDYSSEDDAKVYKNPRNSPSAECPRDEEHAEFIGQKCLRKCSNDEDCKSKKKKCLCDGVCGMSCIKPERECEELSSPALGSLTVSGRLFGDRAVYSCEVGYTLVGLKERTCQGDGNWSGAPPQCKHNVYCKTPPELEHARHNALREQTTFPLDTTLQYQCNLGYVTNGFPNAKCLAIDNTASWFGPDISCEPRSCGPPTDPSNGWHSGDCYTYSCKVMYHCGEGYELVGRSERICQPDGIWGPRDLPACVLVTAVECPLPESPQYGTAIYTSCGYNAVVSYECRHGYTLVGDSTRRCGADRKWSGSTPKCQVVDCGHPGAIYNGWIENLEGGTGLGASIIFRCSPGMTLVGNASSVCQIDGLWRYPPPLCLASCVVPAVAQGKVVVETNGSMDPVVVPHGHQLTVKCETRYEPAAEAPILCNNGSWSQIPKCQPARCKYLPKAPKNGIVIAPRTQHGMKARFKCRDGYVIRGQNTSECRYGNWTGEQPYCQEVYCPFPGYVENGKVLLVGNMGLYDYRPYVRKVTNNKQIMYECNKGYALSEGPPGATCIAGHWSPKNLPRCVPGLHPRLRWNRKKRALAMRFLRRAKAALVRQEVHRAKRELVENSLETQNPHRFRRELLSQNPRRSKKALMGMEVRRQKRQLVIQIPRHSKKALVREEDLKDRSQGTQLLKKALDLREVLRQKRELRNRMDPRWKEAPNVLEALRVKRELSQGNKLLKKALNVQEVLRDKRELRNQRVERLKKAHNEQEVLTGKRELNVEDVLREKREVKNQGTEYLKKAHNVLKVHKQDQKSQRVKRLHKTLIEEDVQRIKRDIIDFSTRITKKEVVPQLRAKRGLLLSRTHRAKRALAGQNTQVIRKANTGSSKPESSLVAGAGGGRGRPPKSGVKVKSEDGEEEEDEDNKEGAEKSDRKSGKGRRKNRRRQDTSPCEEPEEEQNGRLDLVRGGRDPNNTWSHGAVLRLTCSPGYVGNLPNSTSRCIRGKWKPAKPQCSLAPCKIPESEHGIYTAGGSSAISGQILNVTAPVPHAQVVEFSCRVGYNVQGNGRMKCWHGQWNVPVIPICIPAPCQLPVVTHGQYLLGYRPGLTIGNGSLVRFQCDTEFKPSGSETVVCVLGELRPKPPHCRPDPGSVYKAGGDITKAGEMGEVDYLSGLRGSCSPPQAVQGTLAFKNGEPLATAETNFPDGTEVTFNCITSMMGEKTTWRIICQDGNWLGHPLHCESEEAQGSSGGGSKDNTTCLFKNTEPNVATFYMDQPVTEDSVEFPSGAELIFRCSDIGKYAMIGSSGRKCVDGEWDGQRPSCFGLNQENDYALEKPPTILFRHESGPIAQSNDGKMIIYPGTTLHMECLWIRRFGTPKWAVSHEYRKYEESWSSDPGRDSQLEYRLTITEAVPQDTGMYTCITPTRHSHSIQLVVKAVHCSVLPSRRGLRASTEETKMGTTVFLSCQNGNSLIGAHQLVCLPSGNWSSPLPVCESMECPDLTNLSDSNLRSSVLSREVGGRVVFSCGPGHALVGPTHSTCQASGDWAQPFPTCKEVECGDPGRPENGWVQGGSGGVYKAGDLATFTCSAEYMMEGQPVVACQENGRWSAPPPNCVKACSYPGTVISGRMSAVKFYYSIDEVIEFRCDEGLTMSGPAKIRCLKTGKWSGSIPVCRAAQS